MNHQLNTSITPFIVALVLAAFIGLIMLESRRSGVSAWRRLGEVVGTLFVAFACFVVAVSTAIEYAFKSFSTVFKAEYQRLWAHHISALPVEHAIMQPAHQHLRLKEGH